MFYVYIIRSQEGRYYIGSTENVEKRLKQHNAKGNRGWTNRFQGWVEVYREACETRIDARRRERELKKIRSSKKFKDLVRTQSHAADSGNENRPRRVSCPDEETT